MPRWPLRVLTSLKGLCAGLRFCPSITINGEAMGCIGGCQAIVDTGTSFIVGPQWSVRKIIFGVGAKGVEGEVSSKKKKKVVADHEIPHVHFYCPSIFFQFFVSCDLEQMPNVTFHIQGQEFPLPPSAYTIQVPHHPHYHHPHPHHQLWFLTHPLSHCRFPPTAASPASLRPTTARGSWGTCSSDNITPCSTEARGCWDWPGLNDPAQVSLPFTIFLFLLHDA